MRLTRILAAIFNLSPFPSEGSGIQCWKPSDGQRQLCHPWVWFTDCTSGIKEERVAMGEGVGSSWMEEMAENIPAN